jgi:hypothetical protein
MSISQELLQSVETVHAEAIADRATNSRAVNKADRVSLFMRASFQ